MPMSKKSQCDLGIGFSIRKKINAIRHHTGKIDSQNVCVYIRNITADY